MRRIMFLVGRAAVRSNSKLIREFYTRLRRRGKHYLTAVVAVARKILTIIWRMLVERKPWAEKVKEKPYVKRPVEIKNINKEEVLERLVNLLLRDT